MIVVIMILIVETVIVIVVLLRVVVVKVKFKNRLIEIERGGTQLTQPKGGLGLKTFKRPLYRPNLTPPLPSQPNFPSTGPTYLSLYRPNLASTLPAQPHSHSTG